MYHSNILWRRLDTEGHEACRLDRTPHGWRLHGVAAYVENGSITSLHYDLHHDEAWGPVSARLSGWAGPASLDISLMRDGDGQWSVNGSPDPKLKGARDLDLGFSPSTNTAAIRRLKLNVGQEQRISAAWLDTEDWRIKPLEQEYCRDSETEYTYRSVRSGYSARLSVTSVGLVASYPGLWDACSITTARF